MSFIETLHGGEFIIAELGALSRDQAMVASGLQLAAGTVVAFDDDDELVAYTGSGSCAGILLYPVDAREGAEDAVYIARRAKVRFEALTVPEGLAATTAAALEALTIVISSDSVPVDTGGGGGAWLPSGATTFLDFMGGHYYAGGAEVAASDIIADPAIIQNGVGLVFGQGTDLAGSIIGAALTDINIASATLLFDFDYAGAGASITLNNSNDSQEVFYFTLLGHSGGGFGGVEFGGYDADNSSFASTTDVLSPDHSKLALTFAGTGVSASLNGQDVIVATPSPGPSTAVATRLVLGNFSPAQFSQAWTLRSITAYPTKADNALPALSA